MDNIFCDFILNGLQRNVGQTNGPSGLDLNVEPVWIQGIAGEGIVVGVVDDGEFPVLFYTMVHALKCLFQ